jgi:prepilin signal peptidase PulO-like enzyme (type II secretory pathway)
VAVEVVTAMLFMCAGAMFAFPQLFFVWGIVALLVCIAVYDARHMRIPVVWNYTLLAVATGYVVAQWSLDVAVNGLIGLGVVGGLFFFAYAVSRGRVLGFGDVILALSMGLALGALDGLFAVWVACVVGSIYGLVLFIRERHSAKRLLTLQVPFGPFLVIGFIMVLFGAASFTSFFELLAFENFI